MNDKRKEWAKRKKKYKELKNQMEQFDHHSLLK